MSEMRLKLHLLGCCISEHPKNPTNKLATKVCDKTNGFF